jgi:hypothetical protein
MTYEIISGVLGIVAIVAVTRWASVKKTLKDVADAVQDDKLTNEEALTIINDVKAILGKK